MKAVRIHKKVASEVEKLDFSLKRQLAELFAQLAEGESLGMPVSRPMPVVEHGVHELRVKLTGASPAASWAPGNLTRS